MSWPPGQGNKPCVEFSLLYWGYEMPSCYVKRLLKIGLIPTGVLTSKPKMREIGHGPQPLWISLKLPETVTDAVHHLIERGERHIG
jgi:hypothetical protein